MTINNKVYKLNPNKLVLVIESIAMFFMLALAVIVSM